MAGTPDSVEALRSAMVLMGALRVRRGPEDDPMVWDALRDATQDRSPAAVMMALATMPPAVLSIAETRLRTVLADPELLQALADAARAGMPMDPHALSLSVDDVLAAAGQASVLNTPG